VKVKSNRKPRLVGLGRISLAMTAGLMIVGPAVASPARPAISMQTARAKALAVAPGRVKSANLETENGRLLYSFDIQMPRKTGIEEVQVSAVNGKILSNKHETPAQEKAELKADAQARTRK
jgi:uncharacterized membrane protein YkoI